MINNLLRSGYTFTSDEYELETKYIMTMASVFFATIFLMVMTVFFYMMGDKTNTIIHFVGFVLTVIAIYLHRIIGKNNYDKLVYAMAILFFILILYAYYIAPTIQPISAWIIIQILSSFLVLNITLATWITIAFSSFMSWIGIFLGHTIGYTLLQIAPALISLSFVYIINKKFQRTIRLLEESNTFLENRIDERTRELEIDKNKLDYQAHYDELTALPNRLFLKKELRKRMKENRALSLFVIDLDRFKSINDIYGHGIGDKILKNIATKINKMKGKEDFLSRLSGDEFIFITSNKEKNTQKEMALKIMKLIEEPIYIETKTIYLSASIGICIKNSDITNIEQMMTYADIAMYEAKREGRGNIKFYTDAMMHNLKNKVKLKTEIKQAFADDTFVLYYQPQVDSNKHINTIEVLVRWYHPQKGFILPNDFIGVAEEIDMIVALDYHVLSKGMKQIVTWIKEGYDVPRISFNISGKHLQKDLYLYIENLLKITGCPAKNIELEITEGYIVPNVTEAMLMLEELQKLGIHIAIDDFGKGYSSLSYLKSLPINKIKIDKSFIDNVHTNKVDATIVQSVISIADSLDISVVSEGIEHEAQEKYLIEEGCRYFQGYYYHRPMDCDTLKRDILKIDKAD